MAFFNKINITKKIILSLSILIGGLFAGSNLAFSDENQYGDILGYAWMGTEIVNPGQSEGGGGWLKYSCVPEFCSENNWGVRVDLDPTSSQYGYFSGQAWSSNLGWLDFSPDNVQSCWEANESETASSPARILFSTPGNLKKVVGWGKFLNGDDFDNDGYTGCVSFSGDNYSVFVDEETGVVSGWAWGSDVIGWISHQNPECRFCDTTIVLPNTVDISFWADQTTVPTGGGTTLRWQASNGSSVYVATCTEYGNTSNYSHWGENLPTPVNVGNIDMSIGNLPTGSHPINGIGQTTTYSLRCKDSQSNYLPTKYVTINVSNNGVIGCMDPLATNYNPLATLPGRCSYGPPVVGCMDPAATNYNPLATSPGRCSYGPVDPDGGGGGRPTLNLDADPITLYVNSNDYDVGLTWTSNNPTELSGCVGSLSGTAVPDLGNQTNWDGNRTPPNTTTPFSVDLTTYAANASAGENFVFRLTCNPSSGGAPVFDTATVIMRNPIVDPVASSLDLRILSPHNNPSWTYEQIPPAGLPAVNLGWTGSEIQWDSCQGTSDQYNSNNASIGSNFGWDNSISYNGGPGNLNLNMTSPNNKTTIYRLSCLDTAGATLIRSVTVCVNGLWCPSSPGGFPGYEEF